MNRYDAQQPPGQTQSLGQDTNEFISPIPGILWEDWFDDAKRPDLIRRIIGDWSWLDLAARFPFLLYESDFSEEELTVVEYAERQIAAGCRDTINLLKRSAVGRMALLYVTQQIEVVPVSDTTLAVMDNPDQPTSEPCSRSAAD